MQIVEVTLTGMSHFRTLWIGCDVPSAIMCIPVITGLRRGWRRFSEMCMHNPANFEQKIRYASNTNSGKDRTVNPQKIEHFFTLTGKGVRYCRNKHNTCGMPIALCSTSTSRHKGNHLCGAEGVNALCVTLS